MPRSYQEWDSLGKDLEKELAADEAGVDAPAAASPAADLPGPEPIHALTEGQWLKENWLDVCGDGSVFKKVVTAGDDGGAKPAVGAAVECHYTGRLLDGTQFDSSRERAPFEFRVGSGVIQGWSDGIQTMETGEVAMFVIKPDKAYGEGGSPPKIPGGATLQFEIELLSHTEFENVPGTDGQVQLKKLAEGEGYQTPGPFAVCRIKLALVSAPGEGANHGGAGAAMDEEQERQHQLGVGTLCAGVEAALQQMKKGGKCRLKIGAAYSVAAADEPSGRQAEHDGRSDLEGTVELVDWTEVKDVCEVSKIAPLESALPS
jgi:FKBP-type peptidyl-prolyl cis-trans isomerase